MPNQPFLVFPRPIPATRAKLGSGPGPRIRKPTPAQQKGRLEVRFQEIAAAFKDIQGMVAGVEPEQVIVLETDLKSVEGLAKAAAKIPGLEWLAERDLDEVEPEFNFQNEDKPDARLPRRLYALFSNQQAMDALVALWRNWTAYPDRRAARNFGPLVKNGLLYSYNKSVAVYHCPADVKPFGGIPVRIRSYAMNCYMSGDDVGSSKNGLTGYHVNKKMNDLTTPRPVNAFVFTEEAEFSIDDGHFGFSPDGLPGQGPVNTWYNVPALWHGGANFSYADGHAAYRRWLNGTTRAITATVTTDTAADHGDLRFVQSILATKN